MANRRITQTELDIRAASRQAAAHKAEAARMNAKAQAAKSRATVAAMEYKEAKALADAATALMEKSLAEVKELEGKTNTLPVREPGEPEYRVNEETQLVETWIDGVKVSGKH